MKKTIFVFLCLSLFLSGTFVSCKKYEDGPAFTLLSKKKRLTGDWIIKEAFINGRDETAGIKNYLGHNYKWVIKSDGTYDEQGRFTDAGAWDLIEKKTKIEFISFDGVTRYAIKILRLTDDEFWYEQVNNAGQVFEIHMIQ